MPSMSIVYKHMLTLSMCTDTLKQSVLAYIHVAILILKVIKPLPANMFANLICCWSWSMHLCNGAFNMPTCA